MENYEALGRYVTAKEQAEKFKSVRDMHLHNLSVSASRATSGESRTYFASDFDANKASDLLNKAIEANQDMIAAVNEANSHAEHCGKPKLELFRME